MNKSDLSEILAKNLAYYVNNPKKRCVKDGMCSYSGKSLKLKTKGCFVGALLSPKDRLLADDIEGDVYSIIDNANKFGLVLPKIITDNSELMLAFQSLHDNDINWGESGLTYNGKEKLKSIIEHFNLTKKFFKPFLGK